MYIKQLAPLASQLLAGSLGEFLVRTNKDTTYKLDDFLCPKMFSKSERFKDKGKC